MNAIDTLVAQEGGVHDPNFPSQRDSHIKNIANLRGKALGQFGLIDAFLRIAELEERVICWEGSGMCMSGRL